MGADANRAFCTFCDVACVSNVSPWTPYGILALVWLQSFSHVVSNLTDFSSISISVIYLFASRTNLLSSDPTLWFTMMLMPTGPTAMVSMASIAHTITRLNQSVLQKLTALADVSGSNEVERLSIAKFLSVSCPWPLDDTFTLWGRAIGR